MSQGSKNSLSLIGGGVLAVLLFGLVYNLNAEPKQYQAQTALQNFTSTTNLGSALNSGLLDQQKKKEVCQQMMLPWITDPSDASKGSCDLSARTGEHKKENCLFNWITDPTDLNYGFCSWGGRSVDEVKRTCATQGWTWVIDPKDTNNVWCEKPTGSTSQPTPPPTNQTQPVPTQTNQTQPPSTISQPPITAYEGKTEPECNQAKGYWRIKDPGGATLAKPVCDMACPNQGAIWKFVDNTGKLAEQPYCEYPYGQGGGYYPPAPTSTGSTDPEAEKKCRDQKGNWMRYSTEGRILDYPYCDFSQQTAGTPYPSGTAPQYQGPSGYQPPTGQPYPQGTPPPTGTAPQYQGPSGYQPPAGQPYPQGTPPPSYPSAPSYQPYTDYTIPQGPVGSSMPPTTPAMNNQYMPYPEPQYPAPGPMPMPYPGPYPEPAPMPGPWEGEEGECGFGQVYHEDSGMCEPEMQPQDKKREFGMVYRELKDNSSGKNMPWPKDILRELLMIFGKNKKDIAGMEIPAAIRSLLPKGSEAEEIISAMLDGQQQIAKCFQDKLAEFQALEKQEKLSYRAFQDVRDTIRDCYDLQGEFSDPREAFDSLQSLRMCGDVKRGIADFRKHDFKQIDRFKKEMRDFVDPADLDKIKADIEVQLIQLEKDISEGNCEDKFMEMDDIRRDMFERSEELRRQNEGTFEVMRFAKDEAPFILQGISEALPRIEDEEDREKAEKAKELIEKIISLAKAKNIKEAQKIFEELEGYRDVEFIIRNAMGREFGEEQAREQFNNFRNEFADDEEGGRQMENIMANIERQFEDRLGQVLGQVTQAIEALQSRITTLAEQVSQTVEFVGRLGEVAEKGAIAFQENLENNIASRAALEEKTQELMIMTENTLAEKIGHLTASIGEKIEETDKKLDKKLETEVKNMLEDISSAQISPEIGELIAEEIDKIKDKVNKDGNSAISAEDLKEVRSIIEENKDENAINLVKNRVYAGIDIAENFDPSVWFNRPMLDASEIVINDEKFEVIKGDTDNKGNPKFTVRPADKIKYEELAKIVTKFADGVNNDYTKDPADNPFVDEGLWYSVPWSATEQFGVEEFKDAKPGTDATRGVVIESFVKALDLPVPVINKDVCPDVPKDNPYAPYIAVMKDMGIISGDDKTGNCRPFDPMVRAEVAKVASLTAEKINEEKKE